MAAGYRIRINGGTPIDVGDVLSYTVLDPVGDTVYSIEVQKEDEFGNQTAWSPATTIRTTPDNGVTDNDGAFLIDDDGAFLVDG
jgi:hypothetical protein